MNDNFNNSTFKSSNKKNSKTQESNFNKFIKNSKQMNKQNITYNNIKKTYKKSPICSCYCHSNEVKYCQELLNEFRNKDESDIICIEKLINIKNYFEKENEKLKKHIILLTEQNQSLIHELEIIVSSSEFATIDINHYGIKYLNDMINRNKYKLEKSLNDIEKTIKKNNK